MVNFYSPRAYHWRRKWQPTPVFLPGESQGRWSLVGCRLWGHKESDMTETTQQQQQQGLSQRIAYSRRFRGASSMVQWVNNSPAMQETQETLFQSLGWKDPLEKEMATHSSILAWEIPWTEEPGKLQSTGLQRVRHDLATKPQKPRTKRKQ